MAATSPVRIDEDLYNSAKAVAELLSRSTAQQIAHWARLGRELESDPGVTTAAVADVLAGRTSYDELSHREQALVRTRWAEDIADRLAGLNLAAQFDAEDRSYVELDESGNVVHRAPQRR